jgi:hypothetical protein
MTAVLNLYQATCPNGVSKHLRLLRFTLVRSFVFSPEGMDDVKQFLFLSIINYEISEIDKLFTASLGVAASGDDKGSRISSPCQPEPVA